MNLPVAATAAALAMGFAAAARSPQQPAFRSGVDLVNFGVTVTDRKGALVTSLTPADFEVFEDGQKQTIKYFSVGEGREERGAAGALHVGVLLDMSGSMAEDVKLSRTAAIKFLNTLTDAADITVVDFATEVRVARYGQNDFPRLVERIRSGRADGYTALYDALGVYLDTASGETGRKILVLYTDGDDNTSSISISDVDTLLKASDVTVYAIGFVERLSSSMQFAMRWKLQRIAEVTGGQFFLPSSLKDLEAAYERVKAEIAGQYVLGYISTNDRTDGTWRKVEIKLANPALRSSRIRTRTGYYALYRKTPAAAGD